MDYLPWGRATAVAVGHCRSGTIAFLYAEACLDEAVLKLLDRLCGVELEEGTWRCAYSGIKVSSGVPQLVPSGCTYFEVSQGYYVGLLPGYIDAQCIYCQGDLRCRYSLQRRICTGSETKEAPDHIDVEFIKEIAQRLLGIEGDFVWCLTGGGDISIKRFQ